MAGTPQLETFAGEEEAKRTLAREILAENRLLYVRTIVRGNGRDADGPGEAGPLRGPSAEPDNAQIGLTNTLSREGLLGTVRILAARGPRLLVVYAVALTCCFWGFSRWGAWLVYVGAGPAVSRCWCSCLWPRIVPVDSGWSQRVCPVPFVPDAVHGGAGIGVVFAYIPPCYPIRYQKQRHRPGRSSAREGHQG